MYFVLRIHHWNDTISYMLHPMQQSRNGDTEIVYLCDALSKAMKKAKNSKHMYVWTHDTPHSCMVSYSVLDFFLYIQLYLFHINIVLFWFGLPSLSRTRVTLTKEIAKESFKCSHIIYSPCLETFWKILTQLPSAPQKSPGIVIGIKSWLPF